MRKHKNISKGMGSILAGDFWFVSVRRFEQQGGAAKDHDALDCMIEEPQKAQI